MIDIFHEVLNFFWTIILFKHLFLELILTRTYCRLPGWFSSKESACNAGDVGSVLGSGRSPGGGHGDPLQYSCLENSMDRGAWWATKVRNDLARTHSHRTHACTGCAYLFKNHSMGSNLYMLLLLSRFSHIRFCATP